MHTEDAVDLLYKQGYDPLDVGPDEFAAHIGDDISRWVDVVRAAGLKS
jgi:tripartite-type tricarboxylate transporter receptor subunit TctC